MDYLAQIIKGVLIGTANILPGISGGTLAISMGVYEQILHALTHLHKETRQSLSALLPYIIGIIGGIAGLSFSMEFMFRAWPLQTNLAFIGLIFGGLPGVVRQIANPQQSDRSPREISTLSAACFLTLVIATALSLMKAGQGQPDVVLCIGIMPSLLLFLLGVMSAGTMVVPGTSGSMILMMIGYYQPLLSAVNRTLLALIMADFPTFLTQGIILAPYAAGLILGFYLFALLMETLFSKFARITYCSVLGLVLSSPIGILAGIPGSRFTPGAIAAGAVCFFIALVFVLWLEHD